MEDRIPGKPGRVKITPEDGGAPYYVTMEMADEPSQVGTALNKKTLLEDAVAQLYQLTGKNATPNEAFRKAKSLIDNAYANSNAALQSANMKARIQYGQRTPNGAKTYSINFSFAPKCVFLRQANKETFLVYGSPTFFSLVEREASVSWGNTYVTISLLENYNERTIFNSTYEGECYYVAIG